MSVYNHKELEQKWQKRWYESDVYKAYNPNEPGFDSKKKNYYILDMFPYPSGSGLHVGHASGYIGTDIVARKKRMEGYNVLHPMGWDAFGLPAEQYAIQTNQHPRQVTDVNTANFRRQLKLLALSYDWKREIDTSNPDYYRWTQWVFLQLYKKGLVYRKEMPVWWCEELKTVLANEEVINGRSERGNYPCVRKPLFQWVFKITAYADRLLEDLDELDWPENVKKMQADWIGRSLGAEINFAVSGHKQAICVFSTRPDTLFGVTALVVAPEHPLVRVITTNEQKAQIEAYLAKASAKSDRERKAEEEITAEFTGAYCEHPLIAGHKVPIYIADYVLADYGTGAVMAVPAHDERDFLFAQKYKLPFKPVIAPKADGKTLETCFTEDGTLVNSEEFSGLASEDARQKITAKLESKDLGKAKVFYKIRDWIFSRQRYWGEPFPLYIDEQGEVIMADESELPICLPEMKDFAPSPDGSSPLARVKEWTSFKHPKSGKTYSHVTDTMPGWAGSCWYYLRFMDPLNKERAFDEQVVNYWQQVDLYVGGASHAVMHLLYSRFWHKVLFDLGLVPTKEPFKKLFNQGMVTAYAYKDATQRLVPSDEVEQVGQAYRRRSTGEPVEKFISKMAKSLRNVVNPDDVIDSKGCDVLRTYEMFMGPLGDEKPWADEGISGCEKFLRKVWNLFVDEQGQLRTDKVCSSKTHDKSHYSLHKCLKRINDSFNNFNFNTAIAAMMEAMNELQDNQVDLTKEQAEFFLKMLFPFAPHISSELWERLGHNEWIDFAGWPELDEKKLVRNEFELVLQVNGKIRKKVEAQAGLGEEDAKTLAMKELHEFVDGKKIVRVIFVANKLVNVVVQG